MIECILFDSDGTLVDSETLAFEAMETHLATIDVDEDAGRMHMHYRGWKMSNVIEHLEQTHQRNFPADFEASYREYQYQEFRRRLQPVAGIPELLAGLDQRMAVVTSGPMPKVRLALEVTGLTDYFGDNVYSAYELGVWKPDPEIYRMAARNMGYSPTRCVAVEDSPIGLEAAANSGIHTVFFNRYDDPVPYDHVATIRHSHELPAAIKGFC